VTSLSQALPLGGLLLPHSAFQEHAAHPLEWSRELSSKGSLDTCISKGHSTFSYAAFTAHVGERVDQIAVGVFLEALQGHGATGRIADELFQLIPPMRRNRRVGVEGKPVDTGAVRTREPGRLALRAKARADATHLLSGAFATSDAVLDRSCHGAGEFRGGIAQGIIPGGYGGLHIRFQIAPPAQLASPENWRNFWRQAVSHLTIITCESNQKTKVR
jgi:hypothetical protein